MCIIVERSNMKIKRKNWFQQLLCKHDYQWFQKPSNSQFRIISGEADIRVCTKCGKQNGERFLRYEGMGFK